MTIDDPEVLTLTQQLPPCPPSTSSDPLPGHSNAQSPAQRPSQPSAPRPSHPSHHLSMPNCKERSRRRRAMPPPASPWTRRYGISWAAPESCSKTNEQYRRSLWPPCPSSSPSTSSTRSPRLSSSSRLSSTSFPSTFFHRGCGPCAPGFSSANYRPILDVGDEKVERSSLCQLCI